METNLKIIQLSKTKGWVHEINLVCGGRKKLKPKKSKTEKVSSWISHLFQIEHMWICDNGMTKKKETKKLISSIKNSLSSILSFLRRLEILLKWKWNPNLINNKFSSKTTNVKWKCELAKTWVKGEQRKTSLYWRFHQQFNYWTFKNLTHSCGSVSEMEDSKVYVKSLK